MGRLAGGRVGALAQSGSVGKLFQDRGAPLRRGLVHPTRSPGASMGGNQRRGGNASGGWNARARPQERPPGGFHGDFHDSRRRRDAVGRVVSRRRAAYRSGGTERAEVWKGSRAPKRARVGGVCGQVGQIVGGYHSGAVSFRGSGVRKDKSLPRNDTV